MTIPNSILRRPAVLVLAGALAATTASCGGGGHDGPPKNVILISLDTLRPDHLGCYGHTRDTSPAIDAVAEAGTLFLDVTSAAPWTLPGHASILTGLYPSTHGVIDHDIELQAPTLATQLASEGFQTMAIVNSHNIGTPRYGLMRGFEEDRKEWILETEWTKEVRNGQERDRMRILNNGPEITDLAIEWLEKRDGRPFFFFLHYYDAHTDFTPDEEYRQRFVSPYKGPHDGTTGRLQACRNNDIPLQPADIRFLKEMYDAEIAQLDDVLSRLFDYLDESGLADETLIVITSDHGEEFYEHEGVLHGRTQYQELVAIPLILRGPRVPAGQRITAPVHQVDIAPTILGLLGLEPEEKVDGIDLTSIMHDPASADGVRFLFAEADHNNKVDGQDVVDIKKMVRIQDDKLLFDTHTKKMELYRLETDPGEQQDVSEAEADRTAFLMEELQRHMEGAREGVRVEGATGAELDEEIERLKALGYIDGDTE